MGRDHHLEEDQQQILRLYVHRSVFPLIASTCFYLASEDEECDEEYIRYRDTVFREQCSKIMRYSQKQVGIAPDFCCATPVDSLFEDEVSITAHSYSEISAVLLLICIMLDTFAS